MSLHENELLAELMAEAGAPPELQEAARIGDTGAIQRFIEGGFLGAAGLPLALGTTATKLIPGEGAPTRLIEYLQEQRKGAIERRGTAGKAGAITGRVGAEVGAVIATGGLGGAAALARGAPRLVGVLGAEAALGGAIAAAGPEESVVGGVAALTGSETLKRISESTPGRIASEVAFTVGVGALVEALAPAIRYFKGSKASKAADEAAAGLRQEIPDLEPSVEELSKVFDIPIESQVTGWQQNITQGFPNVHGFRAHFPPEMDRAMAEVLEAGDTNEITALEIAMRWLMGEAPEAFRAGDSALIRKAIGDWPSHTGGASEALQKAIQTPGVMGALKRLEGQFADDATRVVVRDVVDELAPVARALADDVAEVEFKQAELFARVDAEEGFLREAEEGYRGILGGPVEQPGLPGVLGRKVEQVELFDVKQAESIRTAREAARESSELSLTGKQARTATRAFNEAQQLELTAVRKALEETPNDLKLTQKLGKILQQEPRGAIISSVKRVKRTLGEVEKLNRPLIGRANRFLLNTDKLANLIRASLTSLPQTALRNITASLGLRSPARLLEDGMYNVIRAGRHELQWGEAVEATIRSGHETMAALKPSVRKAFMDQLQAMDPLLFRRLHRNAAMDIEMREGQGSYIRFLTWMNRKQELPAREIAYIQEFSSRLRAGGMDPKRALLTPLEEMSEVELKTIFDASAEGTRFALDATVALQFSEMGPIAQVMGRMHDLLPPIAQVTIQPFFRASVGLGRYFWTRMPGVNPIYSKMMGKEISARMIAQQMEGGIILGAALAVRESPLAGPKWYQIWTGAEDTEGNKIYFDARPYQPFASFLFAGELLKATAGQDVQIDGSDWIEAFAGVRRLTGSSLGLLVGFEKVESLDQWKDVMGRWAQSQLSFLTRNPVTGIVRAIEDELFPEEAGFRDLRDEAPGIPNVLNEALSNLPFARRLLPQAASPVRSEQRGALPFTGASALRLLGPSFQTQTGFEEEAKKLGLKPWTRTGLPMLDRLIDEKLGAGVEEAELSSYVRDPSIQELDEVDRANVLRKLISDFRKQYKEQVIGENYEEIKQNIIDNLTGKDEVQVKKALSNMALPDQLKQDVQATMFPGGGPAQPGPTGANPVGLDPASAQFVTSNVPKRAQAPNVFGGIRP